MRHFLADFERWESHGSAYAIASVVASAGSSPKAPGACVAVNDSGEIVGSISAGCLDAAAVQLARRTLADARVRRTTLELDDPDALTLATSCGGRLELVTWIPPERFAAHVSTAIDAGEGFSVRFTWSAEGAEITVATAQRALTVHALCDAADLPAQGCDVTLCFDPDYRLIIAGACEIARHLWDFARALDYRVAVVDHRSAFADALGSRGVCVTCQRPDEYLAEQSIDPRTAVAILCHDAKIDVPLLERALQTSAFYIGFMGSRKTQRDRLEQLRHRGVQNLELLRIRGPIGLDIGALTDAEIATSIMAEIVAVRRGGSGDPLCDRA